MKKCMVLLSIIFSFLIISMSDSLTVKASGSDVVLLYSSETLANYDLIKKMGEEKSRLMTENADVILIDAGGMCASDAGAAYAMSLAGYDIAALPSDYDFEKSFYDGMKSSRFRILCANLKRNGKYLYKPRCIYQLADGRKIGFIGVNASADISADMEDLKRGGAECVFVIGNGTISVNKINEKSEYMIMSDDNYKETKIEQNVSSDAGPVENADMNFAEEDLDNDPNDDNKEDAKEDAADKTDAEEDENNKTAASLYQVVKGDSLWKISSKTYGKAILNRWKEIFDLNKDKISDHRKVYIGQEFELPN